MMMVRPTIDDYELCLHHDDYNAVVVDDDGDGDGGRRRWQ